MISRARAIVLGLLATAVVAVGLLIVTSGGEPTGQQLRLRFEATMGLIPGAEVRAGGVKVGKVEEVTLDDDDTPVVTVRMDDDYVVHEGATASVRMLSQAGQLNRFVEMTSGTGRPLRDGTELGLGRTDQPVELDDALGTLTPEVRANVRRVAASLDRGLAGHGGDLSQTLEHSDEALRQTTALVADLAADGPALRRLLRESDALVTRLAQDPQTLQAVSDRLASTLSVTARRQRELAATVDGLPEGLRGTRQALSELNEATPRVRRLAVSAGPAAREIRKQAPTIRRLLQVAPTTLSSVQDLTETAPAQLEALRPMLRDAAPVLAKLPPTLKQFAPLLDNMRARLPDAVGWLPLLGDALSNYDVNGHAWRLMFVATPPPNTPLKADETGAGLLERPFDRTPGAVGGQPWRDYRKSFVGDTPWIAPENAKADKEKAAKAKAAQAAAAGEGAK